MLLEVNKTSDLRIWKDMVKRKIVNIFQPDVMYMGGLTKASRQQKLFMMGDLFVHHILQIYH